MSLPPGVGVFFREAPVALEQFVAEAVEALGYYRPDAVPELAAMYRKEWPTGTSATMFLNCHVAHLLSEKGIANPDAAKTTTLRITTSLQRWEALQNEPIWSQWCDKVEFHCAGKYACEAALALNGETRNRVGRLGLPLLSCDKEWCGCDWWQV